MFEETKNTVAKTLKIYSIINAIVVILASIIIAINTEEIIFFILGVALGICVNFVIYAFGELIDLLDQIKENTKKAANTKEEAEDLSDILPNL